MFINTFEKVSFFTLSKVILIGQTVCAILSACQWQFEPTFLNFWTFGKILSHLRKDLARLWDHMHSPWRSECSWRLIFEPPKIAKIELSFERELNLGNICWHISFTFFLARIIKNMKIELSFERELNFWGSVASETRYMHLYKVLSFSCFAPPE